MNNEGVRIVQLPPLIVAAAHGFGKEPEGIAWEKILAFMAEKGVPLKGNHRFFGFNNPNPSPGSPNYGYEQWVTVDAHVVGTSEIEIKEFSGGLYAVATCLELSDIGNSWHRLVGWAENNGYVRGNHQWLEELLTSPSMPIADLVLDLYLPIKKN